MIPPVRNKEIVNINLIVVSQSPYIELYGNLVYFKTILFSVLFLCLLAALLMAIALSQNISAPIRKLIKSMSIVQEGVFDVQIEYKRNDEFAHLVSAYNKMLSEIKYLIEKLYISELNKKEAHLKALQAQINPHFLYNTLDSINWLAIKYNAVEISDMITALSNFFRLSTQLHKYDDVLLLESR